MSRSRDILLEKGIDLVEQCNLVSDIFSPDERGKISPVIKRLILFGYMKYLETRRPSLLAEIPKKVGTNPDVIAVINSLETEELEKLLHEHPTRISFEYNDEVFYLVDFTRWREIYPSKELRSLLFEYYAVIDTLIAYAKNNNLFAVYLLADGLLATEKLPPYPLINPSNSADPAIVAGHCEGQKIIVKCTQINYPTVDLCARAERYAELNENKKEYITPSIYSEEKFSRSGILIFKGNPPQPFY